ncbi:MAG: hypothetical protein Q7J01_00285 [Syntrophales bacterium]|nr:hypothetical protein [Syntrophales bacterium]
MEQDIQGITSIKTSQKSKIRSMPRTKGSEYLDLFLLGKNKARLEKEKTNVVKRKDQVEDDIRTIEEEISELEGAVAGGEQREPAKTQYKKMVPKKPLKVMKLDY